jgi:hypothetical protein
MSNLRTLVMASACVSRKSFGGDVEDRGEIGGREIVAQLAQHVDEDVDRGGGKAGFGGHGALPRHGVIGAEDERHGVDQEDAVFR